MNFKSVFPIIFLPLLAALLLLVVAGCSKPKNEPLTSARNLGGLDVSALDLNGFIGAPKIVDCETNAGTKTTCYQLVTKGTPGNRKPGPFCPRTITDGPEKVGAWFDKREEKKLVDLTGQFIVDLPTYYSDPKWKLYDSKTGKVRYTGTKASCFGAAKPDVEEQYKQNCIECKLSYLESDFSRTFLIPTKPIRAARTSPVRTAGIALDGAELAGPAPIDAILESYTIAAFDKCGGHINQHQGYHYHAVTDCSGKKSKDGYASLVGYAPDGYAIYSMRDAQGNEAPQLDECRGLTDPIRGYHYRASSPSENMIIGCLRGEFVLPKGAGPPHGGRPPRRRK